MAADRATQAPQEEALPFNDNILSNDNLFPDDNLVSDDSLPSDDSFPSDDNLGVPPASGSVLHSTNKRKRSPSSTLGRSDDDNSDDSDAPAKMRARRMSGLNQDSFEGSRQELIATLSLITAHRDQLYGELMETIDELNKAKDELQETKDTLKTTKNHLGTEEWMRREFQRSLERANRRDMEKHTELGHTRNELKKTMLKHLETMIDLDHAQDNLQDLKEENKILK
ncbi:hypothetical protein QBC35DRAFT_536271 [Podospora australis]|uniref:Uncharacterized protein n=1 Tax=Podospora australis TaxID=1536484 RepID=A0AAN6WJV2_9PEZI|nr:hypothetical protein QBC35DRAFT_536271 [Podospora australis]